jgi:hypothetical protein
MDHTVGVEPGAAPGRVREHDEDGGNGRSDARAPGAAAPETAPEPADTDRRPRLGRLDRLALGVALLPVVASAAAAVLGVGSGLHPTGDRAAMELATRDVGRYEVLQGLWSRSDWRHPGPVLFYVLAPFYRAAGGSPVGLALGALAINGSCIVGIGLLARRRGGTPLLVLSLLATVLLARTMGAGALADWWNLRITTLPFALLLFLVWSLACGDAWALPVAAFVASFLAQTHVGFVPVALPLLAWGTGALVLRRGRDGGRPWRALAVTAGVLGITWSPLLIDVLINPNSNPRRIVRYFRHTTDPAHTAGDGWRVISAQFALWPEWLAGKRPSAIMFQSPYLYSAPRPLLLVAVLVAAVALWRWAPGTGPWWVLTIGLTAVLSVVAVMRTLGPVFDYRLRWTWVPGMAGGLTVAWAGWLALERARPRLVARRLLPGLAAVLAVTSAGTAVAATRVSDGSHGDSDIIAVLAPHVRSAVEGTEGPVEVLDMVPAGTWWVNGLVADLERHGDDARVAPYWGRQMGEHRVTDGHPAVRLLVTEGPSVYTMDHDPNLERVAVWSVVPADRRDDLQQTFEEIDRLTDSYRRGEIGTATYWTRLSELQPETLGDMDSSIAAVYRVRDLDP